MDLSTSTDNLFFFCIIILVSVFCLVALFWFGIVWYRFGIGLVSNGLGMIVVEWMVMVMDAVVVV